MQNNQRNFAVIGIAGYIAKKHLQAIKETNNCLVATLDTFDSVGFMDNYFLDVDFFTEFERFDRHLEKLKRTGNRVEFISICSPNYLHDSHIRFALRTGSDVICEKPLVLNPWNVDALLNYEEETGRRIFIIMQLRYHPSIIKLKRMVEEGPKEKVYDIELSYITSRGKWYHYSWKGNPAKSGGITTNIGIHFFDILTWIFGDVKKNIVHSHVPEKAAGYLELERARVRWYLSIDNKDIPEDVKSQGKLIFRSITVDNKKVNFSYGFENIHTYSYDEILHGRGFGVDECRKSIQLAYEIRNSEPVGKIGDYHPFMDNNK